MWMATFLAVSALAAPTSTWNCTLLSNMTIGTAAHNVVWTRKNCTGHTGGLVPHVGPIVVNVIDADIRPAGPIRATAAISQSAVGLGTLTEMSKDLNASETFTPLAGVNGGYFWRVDEAPGHFFDDVCVGKTRKDALRNASEYDPDAGVGDSLTIIDGAYASSNCDNLGNSEPAAMILDAPPSILKLPRGGRLPAGVQNAIGAGPNLVSVDNQTGASYVDVFGDNINIVEHASNTAIALKPAAGAGAGTHLYLVTFDGEDGCTEYNPKCGVNAHQVRNTIPKRGGSLLSQS